VLVYPFIGQWYNNVRLFCFFECVFMNNIHYLCNTREKIEFKGPNVMPYKGLSRSVSPLVPVAI
jgi:hypothetical protein